MVDQLEARLRCIEAAARNPQSHVDGYAAGVREAASLWFNWVIGGNKPAPVAKKTLIEKAQDLF